MGGSGADLPRPLPRPQEHWMERSKGLLQDFANGTLERGPGATPPPPSTRRRARMRTRVTMSSLEVGVAAVYTFRLKCVCLIVYTL